MTHDRITEPFQRPQSLTEQGFSVLDVLPVTRGELRRQLILVWDHVIAQTKATTTALERMEERMTTAEDTAYNRLAELIALVKAETASLREQVAAAVADKEAAVAAGVASALGEESARDVERLTGLIAELESAVPVPVPEVPVPAPGEPAELPAEPAQPAEEPPAGPSDEQPSA